MFEEIVFPKNNEKEFIEIAEKLGTKKIIFLYNFEDFKPKQNFDSNIEIKIGIIATTRNINQASKLSRVVCVKSSPYDRQLIESGKISMIYGFEENPKRDGMHQQASGLNHIMCSIAKSKNVAIGFSYTSLIENNPIIAGRMMQNLKLCRKYKTGTLVGSFASNPFQLRQKHDVASLFRLIGMNI